LYCISTDEGKREREKENKVLGSFTSNVWRGREVRPERQCSGERSSRSRQGRLTAREIFGAPQFERGDRPDEGEQVGERLP
jgi:hypothetical protein